MNCIGHSILGNVGSICYPRHDLASEKLLYVLPLFQLFNRSHFEIIFVVVDGVGDVADELLDLDLFKFVLKEGRSTARWKATRVNYIRSWIFLMLGPSPASGSISWAREKSSRALWKCSMWYSTFPLLMNRSGYWEVKCCS
jgi:hypothetical protein